jgi:ATP-dependent helicase HrpA
MVPIRYPADLPITLRREEIVAAIRRHQVVVLAGETGSGKTTQLPKMCLEAVPDAPGMIGCTQPRRVAAMSVSKRVAEELGVQWGREVGCKMRFSDDTSRETRIKFMTDGILLAEIQGDPWLRAYSVVILDEAHERSLNIDFLLGHLVGLLQRRRDLKLLVTSATIDTAAFAAAFGGAPVIEVSGRMFPVDIRYEPMADDEDEEGGFVEAAVAAAENALIETDDGDVLVFMPTERDIRDARDMLEGRLGPTFEVLPLFGRLPAGEQQRIFSPGRKRRVVVATNVAETSITIPRIQCVIDTGLARISRYNAQKRTKRLPVEPVSQSSANQRAGRAGRVRDGICIRLYSQEDYEKRDRFTTPEIQRANLAEVILRLKAFQLGDIETFPFIDPPLPQSVRAGYRLLHELGALDDTHELTSLGRELARLPVDPAIGRMLLQARREKVLPELLIIAAGLSIPDPRERPEEKRDLAQAAHKAFAAPQSDFITLLRIWQAAPPPASGGSRQSLRRFCRTHFLSYTRMQEWRDVWKQLNEAFADDLRGKSPPASDDAIHRCILVAHLGHIATREGRNQYKAGGNREVLLFPGSVLYERREKKPAAGGEKSRQPAWIVAGEMVHTSQLFARMVARVDSDWIAELGAHLCEVRHSEPQWDERSGRVLVTQRTLLHGLEVKRQAIDFLKVDPVGATHMFIRAALSDADESSVTHRFVALNQALRHKVETRLSRNRRARVDVVAERLFQFYDARIKNVSSLHDLNRLIHEQGGGRDDFLRVSEAELAGEDDVEQAAVQFPDHVAFGSSVLPVSYAYKPGAENDGVTVRVPAAVAEHLSSGQIQWMVPGLREELAAVMLRALPKPIRRQLMPIEAKAREIAQTFDPGRADFHEALGGFIFKRFGVPVRASDWPPHSLPVHLQPRVEVVDAKKKSVIAAGRDLQTIRELVGQQDVRSEAWERMTRRIERFALRAWSFGDLPEKVLVEEVGGAPVFGWPGLALGEEGVEVRLFRSADDAAVSSPPAVRRLAEHELAKELTWLAKELRALTTGGSAKPKASVSLQEALSRATVSPVATATASSTMDAHARELIVSHLLKLDPLLPLTAARFAERCASVRRDLPTVVRQVVTLCRQILDQRTGLLALPKRHPQLESDLARLLPATFPANIPFTQLTHLPRYLKALKVRHERWVASPAKDADKAALVAQFDGCLEQLPPAKQESFRWMLEEYRVQVFAQELGTAQPVSPKRLEAMLE